MFHPNHHTSDIDFHDAVKLAQIELGDARGSPTGDSGVVEHDVEVAVEGDGEINRVSDVGFFRDVALDKGCVWSELVGGLVAEFVVDVGDDDLGAVLNELGGCRLADAASSACYKRNLVF